MRVRERHRKIHVFLIILQYKAKLTENLHLTYLNCIIS